MNKVLSVRLPEALYQQAEQLARDRQVSMNSLIKEAVEQVTAQAEEKQLFEAFSQLGKRSGSRVGYAMPMQRKLAMERHHNFSNEDTTDDSKTPAASTRASMDGSLGEP